MQFAKPVSRFAVRGEELETRTLCLPNTHILYKNRDFCLFSSFSLLIDNKVHLYSPRQAFVSSLTHGKKELIIYLFNRLGPI